MLFRLKILPAALMLSLGAVAAQANPPDRFSTPAAPPPPPRYVSDKNLTARGVAVMSIAANQIGSAIDTGMQSFSSGVHRVTGQASALIRNAVDAIGVPYLHGGTSAEIGFDCSGFVRAMVQQTVGKLLPRRAADQAAATQRIDRTELQPGDLVFFNTVHNHAYSHVGIYLGGDKFIHAPSRGERVRIDNMSLAYWQKRFNGARRVLTGTNDSLSFAGATLASADVSNLIVPMSVGHVVTDTPPSTLRDHGAGAGDTAVAPLETDIQVAEATPPGELPASAVTAETVSAPVTVAPSTPRLHAQRHVRQVAGRQVTGRQVTVKHGRDRSHDHAKKSTTTVKKKAKSAQQSHAPHRKKKQ